MINNYQDHNPYRERGIALISSLLATTMLLALGLAIVFSATTDITTTKIQRVGEQAFFTSDAGIGIARRALAEAFTEEINRVRAGDVAFYRDNPRTSANQFPDVQILPPPDGTWNSAFYQRIRDRAVVLASASARAQRFEQINGSSFTVDYSPLSGSVSLQTSDANDAVEVAVLRYSIRVTGKTSGGGSATVHETGRLSIDTTLAAFGGPATRRFKFSGFGAFFDYGDTQASAPLASGTFSGPVHTNTHFAFLSNRSVAFRNVVSQVENKIRYDNTNNTNGNRNIPSNNLTGITLSTEGFKMIDRVPLPENNFSQEYAVINGTGITDLNSSGSPLDPPATIPSDSSGNQLPVFDSSGRTKVNVLAANLCDADGDSPHVLGNGKLANGVYISSNDGENVTGAGIYVQGDASDIQLYADTNGDQVYVIKQSSGSSTKTTTIRTSYTNNRTTISSGNDTEQLDGVFTDKSDPTNIKPGVSLFVNGSINSLRGGKTSSSNRPAIASQTRLTITADQDITVVGDLKYADPVSNTDGTPVSNVSSVGNVFGIFTNDGNLNLAPNSSYVSGPGLSLEMNAAVITFNQNTSNDGGDIDGSIRYTGSTPGNNDRWRLVGSRVQSKINNIGYNYRDIYFDVRFSGGTFAPPFFPGTNYTLGPPRVADKVTITSVNTPVPTAMSWFRDTN